jgi:hypothetical protein
MTMQAPRPWWDRFWNRVDRSGDCWLWRGRPTPKGYGVIGINGKDKYVHQVSYEAFIGPIPAGLVIDHLCRVRLCVNPAHLEPVTNKVNILRGMGACAQNTRKTECPKGHALTLDNLLPAPLRQGKRSCRTCRQVVKANWKRRRYHTDAVYREQLKAESRDYRHRAEARRKEAIDA